MKTFTPTPNYCRTFHQRWSHQSESQQKNKAVSFVRKMEVSMKPGHI